VQQKQPLVLLRQRKGAFDIATAPELGSNRGSKRSGMTTAADAWCYSVSPSRLSLQQHRIINDTDFRFRSLGIPNQSHTHPYAQTNSHTGASDVAGDPSAAVAAAAWW